MPSSPSAPRVAPPLRPTAGTALLAVAWVTAALGTGACQPTEGVAAAQDDAGLIATGARRRETPRVRVAEIAQREMVQVLETTTVLESEVEIMLVPQISGRVMKVLAEEGDPVTTGQILALIDDRDTELAKRDAEVALKEAENNAETQTLAVEEAFAAIDNAKLSRDQAQRDWERNQRLFEGGKNPSALSAQALETSRLELDRAEHEVVKAELAWKRAQVEARAATTAVSRARVALERAELTLDHTSIRAPFDGVVAERTVRVGDTAGSEPVFTLTDIDHLRAVFYRPQRELALFTGHGTGGDGPRGLLDVTATAEALPGYTFNGRIERTSPTVDPDSGSFRVTARMETTPEGASEPQLLPGMLVRLSIVTDRHEDALVAPKRTVRREGELAFVLKIEDGIARRVEVEEGFTDDDDVELLPLEPNALTAGDSLVAVGARELQDGSPVRIETAAGEADDLEAPAEADAEQAALATEVALDDDAGPVDVGGDPDGGNADGGDADDEDAAAGEAAATAPAGTDD